MGNISVIDFTHLTPTELRLAESKHLYEQFRESGRADHDQTLFLMTMFFDSFLFCLISIEEMTSVAKKDLLRETQIFRFFKALRNISTHHSILTGLKDNKFPRPIARVVSLGVRTGVEDAAKFYIIPEKLSHIFDEVVKERPRERKTIDSARAFLNTLDASEDLIYVADLM